MIKALASSPVWYLAPALMSFLSLKNHLIDGSNRTSPFSSQSHFVKRVKEDTSSFSSSSGADVDSLVARTAHSRFISTQPGLPYQCGP